MTTEGGSSEHRDAVRQTHAAPRRGEPRSGESIPPIGFFGYVLRKLDFPTAPIILGFVLAYLTERNLRRALAISDGEPGILFDSLLSNLLWFMAAGVLIVPFIGRFARALQGQLPD